MKTIHRKCGGEISTDGFLSQKCLKCGARWSVSQLMMMPKDRHTELFEVVWPTGSPAVGEERWRLIEVEEEKKRFTKLVKI